MPGRDPGGVEDGLPAAEPFRFKQFSVHHHRSAIKVGTDAVLLGGWTDYHGAHRILDIGTGCGVLALIAAQRASAAQVHGVEIDEASAAEATANAEACPWSDRIRIHHMDVRRMASAELFDLIISNPPFYAGDEPSPDARKSVAKHGGDLDLAALIAACDRLLSPSGSVSLIVPANRCDELLGLAAGRGLEPRRICHVRYVAHRPPKRVLVELGRGGGTEESAMSVELTGSKDYSPEYCRMLSDLMLGF